MPLFALQDLEISEKAEVNGTITDVGGAACMGLPGSSPVNAA